jgi:hypothetical protein
MKRQFVLGAIVLAGGVGAAIVQAAAAAPQGGAAAAAQLPPAARPKVADNLYICRARAAAPRCG